MTKNNFEHLSELNIKYFERAKLSILDPLGLYLANDVKWIKLNQNWNSLKFPVVIGGKGQPILCLLYTSPSPRDLSTSRMPSSA